MARVFVTRQLPGDALLRLREHHEVEVWPDRLPPSPAVLRDRASTAEGLLALLTDRIDGALLAAAPSLRVIANYAVGYDNIDLEAVRERGIAVGNTPDVLTEATADLTWTLMLAAARRLPDALHSARTDWQTWEPGGLLGTDVHGATLLIIGHGRIGQAVAARAAGFRMSVLTVGRDHSQLAALLPEADFISLHCPLTAATQHLIGRDTLALTKSTAILVNTARGPIVDQAALAAALTDGRLGAAALDVTDPEPLALDHPLWQAPNLIIAPHIGSATVRTRERMADIAVDNLWAGLAGRPLPHPVRPVGAS